MRVLCTVCKFEIENTTLDLTSQSLGTHTVSKLKTTDQSRNHDNYDISHVTLQKSDWDEVMAVYNSTTATPHTSTIDGTTSFAADFKKEMRYQVLAWIVGARAKNMAYLIAPTNVLIKTVIPRTVIEPCSSPSPFDLSHWTHEQ